MGVVDHPLGLFVVAAILLAATLEIGCRVGELLRLHDHPDWRDQIVSIRDSLFLLASLLLGFTLAVSAQRFAERRTIVVEEAGAIHSAYLHAGLIPDPYRARARDFLRHYVDNRLSYDRETLGTARSGELIGQARRTSEELWRDAERLAQEDRSAVLATYLEAIDHVGELAEKRVASRENRVPTALWMLITAVSLAAVFARGLTLKSRLSVNLILVPLTIAIVVTLIDELDTPTTGLIRLQDQPMQRLKIDLAEP
jgi:hypothetical protein